MTPPCLSCGAAPAFALYPAGRGHSACAGACALDLAVVVTDRLKAWGVAVLVGVARG